MAETRDIEWLNRRLSKTFPLSAAETAALHGLNVTARRFEPGQYLLREGDRPRTCSFLREGSSYRQKIVGNGGRQIVSIHVQGDFIDVQNILLDVADHSIQALTPVEILIVGLDELLAAAMEHSGIAKALWHESLVEASITREWVANVGRRDARTRTAHMLCELAVRREAAGLGTRDTFDLPMTQEQLGDTLGLTACTSTAR